MRLRMRFSIAALAACAVYAVPMAGQTTPLTRGDAVRTALDRGAKLGIARADSAAAVAALITAHAYPNPSLAASYSKSVPTYHYSVDVPIEFPMLRQLRIQSAQVGVQAAQLKTLLARAMIALDADTTYTHAIAAREKVGLSHRNALDADSLLHMVERRRDAGDASDMDVELARVNAGQQANIATADSLTVISSLLDLQAILGYSVDRLEVQAVDSLGTPPTSIAPASTTLSESAAQLSLQSADLNARLQHRSIWQQFSVSVGLEHGDPSQPGILPTFGIGLGLPIFDRNRGPIATAEAERLRAQAELTLAQVEARTEIARAVRERENALSKVTRDRILFASANRVAAMSLTAYREGASSLTNVLEAERSARDILSQFVDDLANAWIATCRRTACSLSLTPSTRVP